jgi:hypothetical protein
VRRNDAFFTAMVITPDSRGGAIARTAIRGVALPPGAGALELTGTPAQHEQWTLRVDGVDHTITVDFRESLARIAGRLGALVDETLYDVDVIGRAIVVSRGDRTPVTVTLRIAGDSAGGAVVTQQVVFTPGDWNQAQRSSSAPSTTTASTARTRW